MGCNPLQQPLRTSQETYLRRFDKPSQGGEKSQGVACAGRQEGPEGIPPSAKKGPKLSKTRELPEVGQLQKDLISMHSFPGREGTDEEK